MEFEYFVPDDVGTVGLEEAERVGAGVDAVEDEDEVGEQAPVIEGTALAPFEIATRFVSLQSAAFAMWRF